MLESNVYLIQSGSWPAPSRGPVPVRWCASAGRPTIGKRSKQAIAQEGNIQLLGRISVIL